MRFSLAVLALAALASFTSRAFAEATAGNDSPASVEISERGDGVRVVVNLGAPQSTIELDRGLAAVARAKWNIVSPPQVSFAGGDIVFSQPSSRYIVNAEPDESAGDRVYPAVVRIGQCGLAVRPGAFLPRGRTAAVRFARSSRSIFSSTRVWRRGQRNALPLAERNELFFVVRPNCVEKRPLFTFVRDPSAVPEAVLGESVSSFQDSVTHYTRMLPPVAVRPILAVTHVPANGTRWRGDVDKAGATLVRLYGDGWSRMSTQLRDELRLFLHHEAFHLWNGVTYPQRQGTAKAWLSEGAAEYAAYTSLLGSGRIDVAAFSERLSKGLNYCLSNLHARRAGLNTLDEKGGSLPYDCGLVIQWLATGGRLQGDRFFDLWKTIFAFPSDSEPLSQVFVRSTRATPTVQQAMEALLNDGTPERAEHLAKAIHSLGWQTVDVTQAPSNPDAQRIVLFHLLGQDCTQGPYGYSVEPGGLVLDTSDRCSVLAGNPKVQGIEGLVFGQDDFRIYQTVRSACEAKASLLFTSTEGGLGVRCSTPIRELPPRWQLVAPAHHAN